MNSYINTIYYPANGSRKDIIYISYSVGVLQLVSSDVVWYQVMSAISLVELSFVVYKVSLVCSHTLLDYGFA